MTESADNKPIQLLFWGCFIALITTSFGFITRMFLLDDPEVVKLLNLDPAQVGKFKGIQIWFVVGRKVTTSIAKTNLGR